VRPDGTIYELAFENPTGSAARIRAARLDGAPLAVLGESLVVPLVADGGEHHVHIELGPA
jgi:hypothetical protein